MRSLLVLSFAVLLAGPVRAARFTYEPVSDGDDGQLLDGTTWDWGPAESSVQDLLLNLGQEGAVTFDAALAFSLPDLAEGAQVADVRLRLNEQGGTITSGLTVEVSAALDLDPLATAGAARFGLPRTAAKVTWNIPAAWDSSGQRIAKYETTPDLSPVLNELLAQPGWDAGPRVALLLLEVAAATGDNIVRFDDTHGAYWNGGNPGLRPARLVVNETFYDCFHGKELLCRPKPSSVEVNVIPHADADAFVEWGTDPLSLSQATPVTFLAGATAHEFLLSGLTPDTRYYYRLNVRPTGGAGFQAAPVRSFLTLPLRGAEARFCMTTDIHVTNQLALGLTSQMDLLDSTLAAMPGYLPAGYHLWIDVGDLVVVRAQRVAFDQEETEQRYRTSREYIEKVAHSLPFVFVRGNHEEVNGWDYDGTPSNTAIWSGKMLLKYFPPPLPDEFYSGNETPFPDLGLPGNYFAFDVGNLRVRCLDPYLFSTTRPHNGHGETGGSLNGWDWKMGDEQYLWLHGDLAGKPSPFSLVVLHHLTSCYAGAGLFYGRGGIEVADWAVDGRPSFEWGGEDSSGVSTIVSQRPGFLYGSLHDMLVGQGNQVVVKGHEHFHARQQLDGMIYLTMAKPDDTGEHTGNLWGWRWSTYYPEELTTLDTNSGFYSVVVGDSAATYEYIQTYPLAGFGTVRDSFTLLPLAPTDAGLSSGPRVRRTWIRSVVPNPSRIPPRIEYELGSAGRVRLTVHDVTGRVVRELVSGEHRLAGLHDVYWDGRDRNGRRVASGVYFAKLSTARRIDSVKMIVVR